jgi:voltage-gated potassium channel Kch
MLRRFGMKSFYGDATRLDLLRSAGAERAKLFILAIEDEAKSLAIVRMVQRHFPRLRILARAVSYQHTFELLRLGVSHVYRETLGSALDLSVDALCELGFNKERARRVAQIFRGHDEAFAHAMAELEGDLEVYVSAARKHIKNLEHALQSDLEVRPRADSMPGSPDGEITPHADEDRRDQQRRD